MAQEYRPGEIVPQSGIYTITHDPAHADMPHEVTVVKGLRFPTCRHCKGITFQLPDGYCEWQVLGQIAGLCAGRPLRP